MTIDYAIDISDFIDISVIDLNGKVIEILESSYKSKQSFYKLDSSNISSGVYFLNIKSNNRVKHHKLIFVSKILD